MKRTGTRKRPCAICRRWFTPHPRQAERQKTCGRPECQRELHRRRCRDWNRTHEEYFRANYLAAKLAQNKSPPNPTHMKSAPRPCICLGLPWDILMGEFESDHVIILEYCIRQIIRRMTGRPAMRSP